MDFPALPPDTVYYIPSYIHTPIGDYLPEYFSDDKIECCMKCNKYDHTTEYHIMNRIDYYNINVTPDGPCTKCLKTDHLSKYCHFYQSSKNYYDYLDKIYMSYKERITIMRTINSDMYKLTLDNFPTHTLKDKIKFMVDNDEQPPLILEPFWKILYSMHSKEDIDETFEYYSV
jgi:spore coat polysaccharide biosynthesis protein SpsF (cytidylyltransferase family)